MALTNATLLNGATISATGGTTVNFAPSGTEVPDGVEIIDTGAADYRTRVKISCRSKMPTYNSATQTYSKGKRMVNITFPKILASGETVFPIVRLEVEDHPEQTAAERLEMLKYISQVCFDADFATFFTTGSKA